MSLFVRIVPILSALLIAAPFSTAAANDWSAPATRLGTSPAPMPAAETSASQGGPLRAAQHGGAVPTPGTPRPAMWRHLDVIEALEASGYAVLSVRETLLNRVRIRARSAFHLREIVISRASGSILRDVVLETYAATPEEIDRRMRAMPGMQVPGEVIDRSLLP